MNEQVSRRLAALERDTTALTRRETPPNTRAIDVRTYGANGSTTALIAAVGAAKLLGGVPVLLEANTIYTLTASLSFEQAHGVALVGMGYSTVLTCQADVPTLDINDAENVTISNLRLDGVDVLALGAGNVDHIGIRVQHSRGCVIERVWGHNFRIPLLLRSHPPTAATGSWGQTVQDTQIFGCFFWSNIAGLWIFRDVRNTTVQAIHCWANGNSGIIVDDGTTGDEVAGYSIAPTNTNILGGSFNDNTVAGILIEGGDGGTIQGTTCERNGQTVYFSQARIGHGIEFGNFQNHKPAKNWTVGAVTLRRNRRDGINMQGATQIAIGPHTNMDNGWGWASTPAAAGVWMGSSNSYRSTTTAGYAPGTFTVTLLDSPATTGQSGPEFVAGDHVLYEITRTNPTDPSEEPDEYNVIESVNNGAKTVTFVTATAKAIPSGATVTKIIGTTKVTVIGTRITRTTIDSNMRTGIRLDDRACVENDILDNDIDDQTHNVENDWVEYISDNSGSRSPRNRIHGNRRGSHLVVAGSSPYTRTDSEAHRGTLTLNGPTPITVTTDALKIATRIRLARLTAASTAANTGSPQVYSRTNFVATLLSGRILTAPAITGATVLTVSATTSWATGYSIAVTLDDLSIHTTTINGAPGATSVTLLVGLPSAAASGNLVTVTIPGTAGSFQVVSNSLGDNGTAEWELDH